MDLFVCHSIALLVHRLVSQLEQHGDDQHGAAQAQADSKACRISRRFTVQEHVGAENASAVADTNVERHTDCALRIASQIAAGPRVASRIAWILPNAD